VTVELLPHGNEDGKRVLGKMFITNSGSGNEVVGNYHGSLFAEYTSPTGRPGHVLQFHRKSQSVWSLVGAFLKLWGHTKHSPKLMSKSDDLDQTYAKGE
jgi:hypothetical protein